MRWARCPSTASNPRTCAPAELSENGSSCSGRRRSAARSPRGAMVVGGRVVPLAREQVATPEQKNALARRARAVYQRAAAGARAFGVHLVGAHPEVSTPHLAHA